MHGTLAKQDQLLVDGELQGAHCDVVIIHYNVLKHVSAMHCHVRGETSTITISLSQLGVLHCGRMISSHIALELSSSSSMDVRFSSFLWIPTLVV